MRPLLGASVKVLNIPKRQGTLSDDRFQVLRIRFCFLSREGWSDGELERWLRRVLRTIFILILKKILLFCKDQFIFSAGLRSSARPNTAEERGL